jgi:hypothetical protein
MYLSPCFTTVPEKVWLPSGLEEAAAPEDAAAPDGLAVFEPDSGAVASGVCEAGGCAEGACDDGAVWSGVLDGGCDGVCEEGLCEDWSGVLDGVCEEGLCDDGVLEDGACCEAGGISGDGVGCVCGCCWSAGADGVDWALSALPQEIIPMTTARVARNERD